MNKKKIFVSIIILLLLYPVISVYQLHQNINNQNAAEIIEQYLSGYQLSIWIAWLVIVIISIYHKWTTEKNDFFYFTYFFLIIGFGIFGFYFQKSVNILEIETSFRDNYTFGVFAAIQNLAAACVLTGFLQAAVWWFTRRWHRR